MNKEEILPSETKPIIHRTEDISDLPHTMLEQNGMVIDYDLHTCDECIECFHCGIDEDGVSVSRCLTKKRRINRNDQACRHFDPAPKGVSCP